LNRADQDRTSLVIRAVPRAVVTAPVRRLGEPQAARAGIVQRELSENGTRGFLVEDRGWADDLGDVAFVIQTSEELKRGAGISVGHGPFFGCRQDRVECWAKEGRSRRD